MLIAAFDDRAALGAAFELTLGSVDVDEPMVAEELGGAEADTQRIGTVVENGVDRMPRGCGLLWCHSV